MFNQSIGGCKKLTNNTQQLAPSKHHKTLLQIIFVCYFKNLKIPLQRPEKMNSFLLGSIFLKRKMRTNS